jgi:hypothetical protein
LPISISGALGQAVDRHDRHAGLVHPQRDPPIDVAGAH